MGFCIVIVKIKYVGIIKISFIFVYKKSKSLD